jgi:CheY-like chemotaxis protein
LKTNPQPIWIVEDFFEDFDIAKRNLEKSGICNPLIHFSSGDQVLDAIMCWQGPSHQNSLKKPGIVLLDLELPGTNGIEVLSTIKRTYGWMTIPVVVLTSTHDVHDLEECYRKGVDGYIPKPVDCQHLMLAISKFPAFNFELIIGPKG